MKEQLEVTDLKGNKIGVMNVSKVLIFAELFSKITIFWITIETSLLLLFEWFNLQVEVAPCNSKGKEYTEADDKFVDAPDELVGKEVNFVFKIVNCRGIPNKYTVKNKRSVKYCLSYK